MKKIISSEKKMLDGNQEKTLLVLSDKTCKYCSKKLYKSVTFFLGKKREYHILCECEKKEKEENLKESEARKKQNRLDMLIKSSLLDEKFKDKTFNDIIITQHNKQIISKFKEIAKDFRLYKDKSFLLSSHSGTGKSLMTAVLAQELIKKLISVIIIDVPTLLGKIQDTYNRSSQIKTESIFYNLREADLLILDDLGAENHKYDGDWSEVMIYRIINDRYKAKKGIIFSTNDRSDVLKIKLGERNYSRIIEITKGRIFNLNKEKDWRM